MAQPKKMPEELGDYVTEEEYQEIIADAPANMKAVHSATKQARADNDNILADRRARISKLVHARVPQYLICQVLGLDKSTVSRDVQWLREQWREEALENFDEQMTRELEELAVWEAKLSALFIKSKNPRYFDQIIKVKEQRAKLLGLYKPVKVAQTDVTGKKDLSQLSVAELDAKIAALSKEIGE